MGCKQQNVGDVVGQFTTQRNDFLYKNFRKRPFRKRHPEALWFFSAYDSATINCADIFGTRNRETAAHIRAEMTEYLMKQLSAVTFGLDVDFIIALSGETQEQRNAEDLSICLLPSIDAFQRHQSDSVILFSEKDRKVLSYEKIHAVRKQLDLAKNGGLAVYEDRDENNLYTVGILDKHTACKYPQIIFKGHSEWEFHVPSKPNIPSCRLRYKQGSFMMPLLDMSQDIKETIRMKLHNMSCIGADDVDKAVTTIVSLLPAIEECDHGAIVVFLEKAWAKEEAQRLASIGRGFLLPEEKPLQSEGKANELLIKRLASIDGAIVVDFNGNCYAYGVILDGKAGGGVNSKDRGARYNSTKTYIDSFRNPANNSQSSETVRLGVVRSEDGMMDIFP